MSRILNGTCLAAFLAAAFLTCTTAFAAGELKFEDAMGRLGFADPGYGWHSYHDAIVCCDWDQDGDADILVVTSLHEKGPLGSQGRLYVNLLKETGKLAFEDRTEKLMPDGINKKMIADGCPFFFDVNNDGRLDLCSITDEGQPTTFINEGGKFRLEPWGFNAQSCTIKDTNGDGLLDVIGNDTGMLYINEGKGKFRGGKLEGGLSGHMPRDKVLPTPEGIRVDDEAKKLAAGTGHVYYFWSKLDINGDGQPDYQLSLSQAYGFKLLRFYVKTDAGFRDFTAETGLPTNVEVHFMDLNGDGKTDAVTGGTNAGGVYLGDGKGHFKAAPPSDANKVFSITLGGCYTAPQAVVDFNNDGTLDILAYEYRAGAGSALLRGLEEGRYESVLKTGAGSGQVVADLNADGLLDIVSSGPSESKGVHVWMNASGGNGHWLAVCPRGPEKNPFAVNASVEVYRPGKLGQSDALLARGTARSDGMPVHLGLGPCNTVDLRVTFSPGVVKELKDVKTDRVLPVSLRKAE